eukprot:scaffold7302_cov72-Cyclotella_meneghiniana.AAC.18
MNDLRRLIEVCELPIAQVTDDVIDSLSSSIQLEQLCVVHGLSREGDRAELSQRLKEFRDHKGGLFVPIKENGTGNNNNNGKQLPGYSKQNPPSNLWASTQQSAANNNTGLGLSTHTDTTVPSTVITTSTDQKNPNRAIHRIHLSSIRHNYNIIQSTAAQQQCQVIVVVKADGYGHGAVLTSCHLVECGCEAFAVATLEEGVALRKALDEHFNANMVERIRPRVRILVLGAPVGYPTCFDSYLYYDIELMVSGPEVAASLSQWMKNHDGRRRAEVLKVAETTKEELIGNDALGVNPLRNMVVRQGKEEEGEGDAVVDSNEKHNVNAAQPKQNQMNPNNDDNEHSDQDLIAVSPSALQTKMNAATLTNVTGNDLAREVRQILIGQKHATTVAAAATSVAVKPNNAPKPSIGTIFEEGTPDRSSPVVPPVTPSKDAAADPAKRPTSPKLPPNTNNPTLFCGIDDAAKASRQKEMRMKRLSEQESDIDTSRRSSGIDGVPLIRKKLRWLALIDSGMGRLGFTTRESEENYASNDDDSSVSSMSGSLPRGTIEIIQELYDAEVHENAPIEFYGMCTHMADANDKSTYTHDQMNRFRSLINRARAAGISIPTISTDNSAALLTTSLTHFDPDTILSHDTRGYVRTGGGIYGQRPAFKQLRAVSTLVATVSNVAIIQKGESVGYDRAYVAKENVRIATLTIGFADGYPRELGNGVGRVCIRDHTFPIAGNVCMDMLMVELGAEDDKGVGSLVSVGDTAVLWGPEKLQDGQVLGEGQIPLAELAAILKTTQSALTCGLDKIRVQRQLVE